MAYGSKGYALIGIESNYGIGEAFTSSIELLNESLSIKKDRFELYNMYGGIYEPLDAEGMNMVEGSITFPVNPISIGYFLACALDIGSLTVISSGNLFKNYFSPRKTYLNNSNPLRSLTIRINRDQSDSTYYLGCVVNKLSLSLTKNSPLNCTIDFIGKSHEDNTNQTPTFVGSPVYPFDFFDASFSGNEKSFIDFNLSINNNLIAHKTMDGTKYLTSIKRNGPVMVDFNGTIRYDTTSNYFPHAYYQNNSSQLLNLTFTKAASFALVIGMPKFTITKYTNVMGGGNHYDATFTGKTYFDSSVGPGTNIEFSLTNTKSQYDVGV